MSQYNFAVMQVKVPTDYAIVEAVQFDNYNISTKNNVNKAIRLKRFNKLLECEANSRGR